MEFVLWLEQVFWRFEPEGSVDSATLSGSNRPAVSDKEKLL